MLLLSTVSEIRETDKEKQEREDQANISLFKEIPYGNVRPCVNEYLVSQAILKPWQILITQ